MDDRSDLLTRHHADDRAVSVEAEKDHGELVVTSHADGCRVGDLEIPRQIVVIGQLVELDGIRVLARISRIHPVDTLLAHQQHLCADLQGSLSGDGVGREVRHARTGAEDDNPTLLEMPLGAARDVRLGHLPHGDGGLDARLDANFLQKILQGKAVHDGAEHAHVVGPISLHSVLLQLGAAKEIAAAHNDSHLDAHLHHDGDLLGKPGDDIRVDADLATTKDLTRELQHHALVRTIHPSGSPLCWWSCSRMPTLATLCYRSCSRNADARNSALSGAVATSRPPRSVRTAAP